ncbi:hypothetical protein [Pantoea ananatis]|uniref:hypothetical protein n=1 Tax=Pantoea ananas TaxID=553 RepID=UPI000CF4E27B|nr:hypothetical protein [Pantoea ananatis]PQK93309.1 hypothetical protein CG433_11375 [Pantoea ananatis]
MKNLIENINRKRHKTLNFLTGSVTNSIIQPLSLDIDEKITPYEKSVIKDYAIKEVHYFERHYDYLISIDIKDYGLRQDDGEYSPHYNDGELKLDIDSIDHKSLQVTLKGSLFGDTNYDSSMGGEVVYDIVGIKLGQFKNLKTEEHLVIEGERLYDEGNYKMAFFMFFSAVESLINSHIDKYLPKVHSELHYSVEYLSLEDKLRVAAKEALNVSDLNTVGVWGKIMGTFNSSKNKRNLIAHGKTAQIDADNVDDIYLSLLLVSGVLNYNLTTFNDINRKIFK